jgi:hypothetical protein
MKISVPKVKPRNPLVPAAAKRKAGKHEKSKTGQRQEADRNLQRELANVKKKA